MAKLNAYIANITDIPDKEFWDAVDEFLEDKENAYHEVWADWYKSEIDQDESDCCYIIGKYLASLNLGAGTTYLLDNTW